MSASDRGWGGNLPKRRQHGAGDLGDKGTRNERGGCRCPGRRSHPGRGAVLPCAPWFGGGCGVGGRQPVGTENGHGVSATAPVPSEDSPLSVWAFFGCPTGAGRDNAAPKTRTRERAKRDVPMSVPATELAPAGRNLCFSGLYGRRSVAAGGYHGTMLSVGTAPVGRYTPRHRSARRLDYREGPARADLARTGAEGVVAGRRGTARLMSMAAAANGAWVLLSAALAPAGRMLQVCCGGGGRTPGPTPALGPRGQLVPPRQARGSPAACRRGKVACARAGRRAAARVDGRGGAAAAPLLPLDERPRATSPHPGPSPENVKHAVPSLAVGSASLLPADPQNLRLGRAHPDPVL